VRTYITNPKDPLDNSTIKGIQVVEEVEVEMVEVEMVEEAVEVEAEMVEEAVEALNTVLVVEMKKKNLIQVEGKADLKINKINRNNNRINKIKEMMVMVLGKKMKDEIADLVNHKNPKKTFEKKREEHWWDRYKLFGQRKR